MFCKISFDLFEMYNKFVSSIHHCDVLKEYSGFNTS